MITLIKGTVWQIRGVFAPETAIRRLRFGKRTLDRDQAEREYTEATVVFVLWIVFLIVGVAVLLWVISPDHPLEYVTHALEHIISL